MALAAALGTLFDGRFVLGALFLQAIGTVTLTVCFNAYLMDYSERTEMSAVYSTFRDVSNVVTPAINTDLKSWLE